MQLVLLDRADLCQSFYAPLHRESMPPGVTTSHVKKISLRPGVNLSRSFNLKKNILIHMSILQIFTLTLIEHVVNASNHNCYSK